MTGTISAATMGEVIVVGAMVEDNLDVETAVTVGLGGEEVSFQSKRF